MSWLISLEILGRPPRQRPRERYRHSPDQLLRCQPKTDTSTRRSDCWPRCRTRLNVTVKKLRFRESAVCCCALWSSVDVQVAKFRFASEPGCPEAGVSCGHEFAARPAFRSGTYLNRCYLSRCGISAARTSPRSSFQYRKCRVARGPFLGVCWPWLSVPGH
jgi:hypothetical protein